MSTELSEDACRERYGKLLRGELRALSDAGNQTEADRRPVVLDQQSVGRLSRMDALQGRAMAVAMQGRRDARPALSQRHWSGWIPAISAGAMTVGNLSA